MTSPTSKTIATAHPVNHWPYMPAGMRPAHAAPYDTLFAEAAITCPVCREMLEKKVAAHSKAGATKKEREFFTADAKRWQAVLDRTPDYARPVGASKAA